VIQNDKSRIKVGGTMTKLQSKMKELRISPQLLMTALGVNRGSYYETYVPMRKVSVVIAICDALEEISGERVSLDEIVERSDKL